MKTTAIILAILATIAFTGCAGFGLSVDFGKNGQTTVSAHLPAPQGLNK